MPYLFLFLSLASSLAIAILLRYSEGKARDRVVVIASNYIVASALGFLLTTNIDASPGVYGLGVVLGLFFFVGFMLFSKAIKFAGLAGAVTMGRISLAIPVAFSIFLWGEKPSVWDFVGLALIFFIILAWEGKIGKISPVLLSLFTIFGLLDAAMKFFKIKFPATDEGFFLVILFFSAIIWSWGYILYAKRIVTTRDVLTGLLLGIPNFFSSYCLLRALIDVPGYVAFPFINIGIIILSALSGFILFKERLTLKRVGLICLGIVAVFILTM
jgi:drug/metabolite transporter (DMT)-like permease